MSSLHGICAAVVDWIARSEWPLRRGWQADELPAGPEATRLVCHTSERLREPPRGPCWTWTRSVGGETITRALCDEQAERYRAWSDNTRRLRELVDALKKLSIEQAETDD